MKTFSLKEWLLFSIPSLLMGMGLGLSFAGNPVCFYIFLAGVILATPTLWLIYKHK